MKLTDARRRALEAVQDGKCFRHYHQAGNTLHGPKGVSATTLWHLVRAGLIEDRRGGFGSRPPLALTVKGAATWAEAQS